MDEIIDSPLVSVIIPTFNRWLPLRSAIESVWRQHYRPLELIVVDDGSEDETPSQCPKHLQKFDKCGFRSVYLYQENQGAPAARNKGIARSTGQIIQFLDADDVLLPGKIAAQVLLLVGESESERIVYGPWLLRTEVRGRIVHEEVRQSMAHSVTKSGSLLAAHLAGWFCPPHAYLWTKAAVQRVGYWDESLLADQDGDYMLRALAFGIPLVFCSSQGAVYRIHGDHQVSARSSRKALMSRFRVAEKMEALLSDQGRLGQFKCALAARYYGLQKVCAVRNPDLADQCAQKICQLCSDFEVPFESRTFRLIKSIFGLRAAQWVTETKQNVVRRNVGVRTTLWI